MVLWYASLMKIKNRNKPTSGFTSAALALAQEPTTFTIYSVASKPKPKRVTADAKALATIDRMAVATLLGRAMREQGKHVRGGCAAVYDRNGVLVTCGCGKRICWRCVTTGRFCPDPTKEA